MKPKYDQITPPSELSWKQLKLQEEKSLLIFSYLYMGNDLQFNRTKIKNFSGILLKIMSDRSVYTPLHGGHAYLRMNLAAGSSTPTHLPWYHSSQ